MNSLEEHFYEQAAYELAEKCPKPGIMAKAFSDCEGDEKKAYALYIKLRVQQLSEEYLQELNRKKEEARNTEEKAREAARIAQEGAKIIKCYKCHYEDYSEKFLKLRGNSVLFLILLICGILPGLIYSLVVGCCMKCPKCQTILQEKVKVEW